MYLTQIDILNWKLNRKYLTFWSVDQAGLNCEKTGCRKSRWTVPFRVRLWLSKLFNLVRLSLKMAPGENCILQRPVARFFCCPPSLMKTDSTETGRDWARPKKELINNLRVTTTRIFIKAALRLGVYVTTELTYNDRPVYQQIEVSLLNICKDLTFWIENL